MLIGIVSDIHANAHALAPVLESAKQKNVERLFVLGDMTGYYFNPLQVMQMLEAWKTDIIRGNHEDMLASFRKNDETNKQTVRERLGPCFDACLRDLSVQQQDYLVNLPPTRSLKIDGLNILLSHGSPNGIADYLYPDTPKEKLELFDREGIDFMFMGHTHRPMIFFGKHTTFINPGSVGQSRLTGGLAQWGIFNTENQVYMPVNTPYDTSALKKEILANGVTETHFIYEVLGRNR